jgi:hypothetical protein
MAKTSVPKRPRRPFKPGSKRVNCSIDRQLNGPELVRRLAAGGLELRTSSDGKSVALVKSVGADQLASAFNGIRTTLFQASGVVHSVRWCLDGDTDADESQLASALEAAQRIIDNAASALEGQP